MDHKYLRAILCFTLLLLVSASGYASGWQKAAACADKKAQKKCYHKAIKKYKHVLAMKSLPADSAYAIKASLANCYMKKGNSLKAEPYYADAVKSPLAGASTIFNYARCLQSNGKYVEAKNWFDKITDDKSVKDKMPKGFSHECERAIKYTYNNKYAISRQQLNTNASEFAPAFYRKGIAYTSNASKCHDHVHRHHCFKEYYAETFIQYQDNGELTYADPHAVRLCSKLKGIAVSFNAAGDEAYITRKYKQGKNRGLKIVASTLKHHHHWTCGKKLNFEMPGANYGYASLSADGSTIYFSSDVSGSGYGGMDIYAARRNGNAWETPINLGPLVNSSGNETYPFIAADGSLYLASDGHPGYGGIDLFHCKIKDGKFAKPDNMGVDFNSPKDDISMIVDTKRRIGYFASNRDGDKDIYSFRLAALKPAKSENEPQSQSQRTGKIIDRSTTAPISGARVEISKPSILSEGAFYYTNDSGLFHFEKKIDADDQVRVTKEKYKTNILNGSNIADARTFEISMDSEVTLSNARLDFTTIYYDVNRSNLTAGSMEMLRPVIDRMKSSPGALVYISGYADERGGDTYNYGLSLRRVKEIVDYLSSQGVDMLRIRSAFFGAVRLSDKCRRDPKCAGDTDHENRRVEIYISNQ